MSTIYESERAAYMDGYATGVTWTAGYRPGGPYSWNDASRLQNRAYLRGFDDARAKREPDPVPIAESIVLGYN